VSGLGAIAELVRLPAALSVPGDSLAGAAAAGFPFGRRTALMPVASACLYWAGMALNDWADRECDALERPERPIPSGRVQARHAAMIGAALAGTGVVIAGLAGGPQALLVAVPLAATVLGYDLVLKASAAGPFLMAGARFLDVCLGAGTGHLRAALPAAGTVAVHTLSVTMLSRSETVGTSASRPIVALAATAAVAASVCAGPAARRTTRAGAALLATGYAASVGRAQLAAAHRPGPAELQRAVTAGILGMIPLQAGLAVRPGSMRVAASVLSCWLPAVRLARRVSPT
jgi:4-hydroxybenzoate polyprenyltransferase